MKAVEQYFQVVLLIMLHIFVRLFTLKSVWQASNYYSRVVLCAIFNTLQNDFNLSLKPSTTAVKAFSTIYTLVVVTFWVVCKPKLEVLSSLKLTVCLLELGNSVFPVYSWLDSSLLQYTAGFSRVFLSFLAFICSKDRQVNQGEEEFPTIDAKNNTDEVEKPTENTGDTSNNFIIIVLER